MRARSGPRSPEQRVRGAVAVVLHADVGGGELNVAPNHRERAMSEQLLQCEDVTAAEDEPLGARVTERVRR